MVVVVRRAVARNPERLQQEMEEVFRALFPPRPRFPSQTREHGARRSRYTKPIARS